MRRIFQRKPFQVALIAASVLLAAWLVRFQDPGLLQVARDAIFDQYQRFAPRAPPALPIRIVDIDDDSVRRHGQWPWPRTMLAEVVDRLHDLGAAVVAFDMVFSEPDRTNPAEIASRLLSGRGELEDAVGDRLKSLPDNDAILARSLARQPAVIGFFATRAANGERPRRTAGFAVAGDDPMPALLRMDGAIVSLPALEAAALGVGSVSLAGGRTSDAVRRVPLFVTDGETIYPTLAMEALRIAAGASTYILKTASASGETSGGTTAMVSVRVGSFVAPTTAAGEIQLHFKRDRASDYISVSRFLDEDHEDLAPLVDGHIVFVGASAVGLSDLRVTSLGETVPGVSLHAQIVEQIMTQSFLERPDWAEGAEFAMTIGAVLLMMAVLPFSSALVAAIFGAICAATVAAISWIAFRRYGVLIEPLFAMLTGGTVYILAITLTFAASERERRFVRSAFQHYLAPALLTRLEAAPEQLILGGEVRDMTVLFMDVRDFTGIAEKLPPGDLVAFLNRLFSPLSDIIQAHEGAIDKYIGDSIMAFWNAPLTVEDHPRKACRAALKMVEAVEALNRSDAFGFRDRESGPGEVRIGIGLATGDACVGNMGSSARFNYSVIGDTVNIAARIESETKAIGCAILLSGATAEAVSGMALLPIGNLVLKGKSHDVVIHALVGDEAHARSSGFARLKEAHDRLEAALADRRARDVAAAARDCLAHAPDTIAPFYRNLERKAAFEAGSARTASKDRAKDAIQPKIAKS